MRWEFKRCALSWTRGDLTERIWKEMSAVLWISSLGWKIKGIFSKFWNKIKNIVYLNFLNLLEFISLRQCGGDNDFLCNMQWTLSPKWFLYRRTFSIPNSGGAKNASGFLFITYFLWYSCIISKRVPSCQSRADIDSNGGSKMTQRRKTKSVLGNGNFASRRK